MKTLCLASLLLLAACPPPPCICPTPDKKCECAGPDASTSVPVLQPDAGASACMPGCTCPAAVPAVKRVRHLTTPAQSEHSAVCKGADAEHPHRMWCMSRIHTEHDKATGKHRVKHFAMPAGLSPADLASAYKLPSVGGEGQTIAVVDAYGYPNAESDLAAYRKQYGLPACTVASGCLRIVNQSGKMSPLPAPPPADDDWTVETALDLDMASAACPSCKLLLVQADDDFTSGLFLANNTAAMLGASVVSNSWGGEEPENGSSEAYFSHPGIGYFASTGDDGTGASYPATSAMVTAVGGTTLTRDPSTARGWTEQAWAEAGSGCSAVIGKPGWQVSTKTNCSMRAEADVSAVADPNTGLAVYNAANGGWITVGGTSASSPFVAGVMALTGHSNAGPGWAYASQSDFNDVVSGNNGSCGAPICRAGLGWDGPTGLGTPNGSVLAGGPVACPVACCPAQK